MINPKGRWNVIEANDKSPVSVSFENDGDAWSVVCERDKRLPELLGVGYVHKGFLCVARGLVQQDAELGHKVGLVKYDLRTPGELPARWYHCSLGGILSEGLSSDGPATTIVGEYRADYASGDGTAFNPLRKTIIERSDRFEFSWWDDDKFHYLGVGCIVADDLFAAWGPPGAIVQFAYYNLDSSGSTIRGRWHDFGRSFSGIETLKRP